VNRKNRPPTQQGYLNRYFNATMTTQSADTANSSPLLVTFGNKPIQGRQKVFEVHGTWNGNAYVYK